MNLSSEKAIEEAFKSSREAETSSFGTTPKEDTSNSSGFSIGTILIAFVLIYRLFSLDSFKENNEVSYKAFKDLVLFIMRSHR
ncbi:MAG: hypothetical protein EOP06_04185 [Proteobacteria bacterium]|nr:MAG: hypothetical protein EOP06_04185 [Pseudomonadota bacterium]